MKSYPSWFTGFIIITIFTLFITGLLLTPTTLDMRLEWDVPWRLTADQRLYTVACHVAFSYIMLCLFGAIWRIHILIGMKLKQKIYSGLSLTTIMIVLTVTGVGIFYLGNETASEIASLSHLLFGTIIIFFFLFHILTGKKQKS